MEKRIKYPTEEKIMAKSKSSKDKEVYEIVSQEISKFNNLIRGHEKILQAIAKL